MALLSKDALMARPELPVEDVDLPEFNGSVRVRAWYGSDKDDWDVFVGPRKDDARMIRAAGVAASCIDENGNRLFNMNEDVQTINNTWPAASIERVFSVVMRLNNLGRKEAEDAEKN